MMGIEPMLAVGHNATNGRFREAVAAHIKDCAWSIPARQGFAALKFLTTRFPPHLQSSG